MTSKWFFPDLELEDWTREFLEDLVSLESSFRPSLDGSINSFRFNVEDVLLSIYRHPFDLQRDILTPAAIGSQPRASLTVGTVAQMLSKL